MATPTILLIGTADTKADELLFLKTSVERAGAIARIMDVGVLGEPPFAPDYSKHDVAAAAATSNRAIIALGDENSAMVKQAEGAAKLAASLCERGQIDGMLAIGGSMATDLALDVASALPTGVPKMIASTVAFSPLLPPDRIPADVMMILWSAGLYGLNTICQSILSQAAGAVVGACRSTTTLRAGKPIVGISSLGTSSLKYIVRLKLELEKRGYEVAVFHTTGMGGRALESLAKEGKLAAVMDFSLIEVSNYCNGSVVNSGAERLLGAGQAGIPRIVAPGGVTLIDFQSWAEPPVDVGAREIHVHNRLISCVKLSVDEKVAVAAEIAAKLNQANGPSAFIMPLGGIDEWDKQGAPFHDPEGLSGFAHTLSENLSDRTELHEIDAHINDAEFAATALRIFDRWVNDDVVVKGTL